MFKEAAERVRTKREQLELWQTQVDASGAVETTLHELANRRDSTEEAVSAARERLAALEEMAKQAAAVLAADLEVMAARQDVERIQRIDEDITTSEKKLAGLAGELSSAEQAVKDAKESMAAAAAALQAVEKDTIAAGPDSASADTVARQALELRRAAASRRPRKRNVESTCSMRFESSWRPRSGLRLTIGSFRRKPMPPTRLAPRRARGSGQRLRSFSGSMCSNGRSRRGVLTNR